MSRTGVAEDKEPTRHKKKFLTSSQPDAYTRLNQDRSTYLTTYELAGELKSWMLEYGHGGTLPYPVRILKWCKLWFGELPEERLHGRSRGYRIPLEYRYVARAWTLTENVQVRDVAQRVLLADPKPWVITVDNIGSTHYTHEDVLDRIGSLLLVVESKHGVVSVLNVGPMEELDSELDSGRSEDWEAEHR